MSKIHVRLLKEAKKQLKDEEYICWAIKIASERVCDVPYCIQSDDYETEHKPTYDILMLIDSAISGYSTVSHWLQHKHNIHLTEEELYEYRQQWLDQMIEYWRDK